MPGTLENLRVLPSRCIPQSLSSIQRSSAPRSQTAWGLGCPVNLRSGEHDGTPGPDAPTVGRRTHDHPPVYPNDEVEPGFDWQVRVGVTEDLEARGAVYARGPLAVLRLGIEGSNKAIERIEHVWLSKWGFEEVDGESR